MSPTPPSGSWPRPVAPDESQTVYLQLSPTVATWPIARIVAGSFAVGLGLPIDAVEDFRLAVHEAVNLASQSPSGNPTRTDTAIELRFSTYESPTGALGALADIAVDTGVATADSAAAQLPDRSSFGWLLLAEVSNFADAHAEGGQLHIQVAVTGPEAA